MKIVIKNGKIVTSEKVFKADILVDGEIIKKVEPRINEKNAEIFDAKGLLIFPGLIDPHVHFRDPGATQKEDFYTGSSAALAGGVTTVLDMPNNTPPTVSYKTLVEKIKIAKQRAVCDYGFNFGATSDNVKEFVKVRNKVSGIKMYLNPTTGPLLLSSLTDVIPTFKNWRERPILVHAEGRTVAEVIGLVSLFKKQVHFCHIGAEELALIIEAKKKGLPITCGVTPHHLFLSTEEGEKLGTFAKMKPPLIPRKQVSFLWKNLKFIDLMETDHAPHTLEEKNKPSNEAPYGVTGLETYLPLLLDANRLNKIGLKEIVQKTSENPAKIFRLKNKGKIQKVFDADFAIVDPDKSYTIRNEDLKTKCKWTPFNGRKVKGKVVATFLRGNLVYKDGEILVEPGYGRLVNLN